MRGLLAEDNIDRRQRGEHILTGPDIAALAAPDGLQALEMARTASPDLIILDINMPGLSGFEVCARLKADAALATIPVLMLTALDQVDDRVKALGLGADDYLTKPFNPR